MYFEGAVHCKGMRNRGVVSVRGDNDDIAKLCQRVLQGLDTWAVNTVVIGYEDCSHFTFPRGVKLMDLGIHLLLNDRPERCEYWVVSVS